MSEANGRTLDRVVGACAWCDMPLPRKRVVGNRFCSRECKTEMKRLVEWEDCAPAVRDVPWPPHYLEDWAWKWRKWHVEGWPGNIARVCCGWQHREHRHE